MSALKNNLNSSFRVAGVDLPARKHIVIALTSITGVGRPTSQKICEMADIKPSAKVCDLPEGTDKKIIKAINDLQILVEGDLKRKVAENIKRKKDNGSYQGLRHKMGLPVRGQRTKTNARIRKGKKKGKK